MAGDSDNHPSWSELDALRTNEGTSVVALHLETCASCRTRMEKLTETAADLRNAGGSLIAVPDAVEGRILWSARKQARIARTTAPTRRRRLNGSRWAVAAALILAIGAAGLWRRSIAPVQVALVAGDVDGNGRVDIRDAFILAKAIDAGRETDPAWDIDGNDTVNMNDVDGIARAAVSVSTRG